MGKSRPRSIYISANQIREFGSSHAVLVTQSHTIMFLIIWQGKSERSDWFFLGREFTIRTVSTETIQAVYFFILKATLFLRIEEDDDELANSKTNERIQ